MKAFKIGLIILPCIQKQEGRSDKTINETVKLIKMAKHKKHIYQHDEKSDRLFNHQMKEVTEKRNQITEITTRTGSSTEDQREINDTIKTLCKFMFIWGQRRFHSCRYIV